MNVTAYPQPGKQKALMVCHAFAAGVRSAGGKAEVCATTPHALLDGDAFFYGVRPFNAHLWAQCREKGRTFFYCDNAYFDSTRERYFRVTRNAIQHTGRGRSDGQRFAALNIPVKPMRRLGSVVVAAAQSAEFMATVGDPDWLPRRVSEFRAAGHQVLIRHKGEARPLKQDLERARLLVTWSSAAAVTALLEGVPVECSAQCCAHDVAERKTWAGVLADQQWTLREMERGICWKALNA